MPLCFCDLSITRYLVPLDIPWQVGRRSYIFHQRRQFFLWQRLRILGHRCSFFGTTISLSSFIMFPTTTKVLALLSSLLATLTSLETDIGYLVVPLWFSLL